MNTRQYAFAHAVLRGERPIEAYQRIYQCSASTAATNAGRALRSRGVAQLIEKMRHAESLKTEEIRRELTAHMLEDIRNEELPPQVRATARKQLMELYALDKQVIEISTDEAFRDALIRGATEPFVRQE